MVPSGIDSLLEAIMAMSLPYLSSYKNVGTLFDKIASAKVPPKFTHEFLQNTIGLKGTNDRPLITLLRNMGWSRRGVGWN
jgi:hypothetical protein